MNTLALTEDETMLVDAVATMLDASAPVENFRKLRDEGSDERWREALWQEMVEMALPAIAAPGEDDSFGVSGAVLVCEQLGYRLAASPLVSAIMARDLLEQAGAADLAQAVGEGSSLAAIADPASGTLSAADDTIIGTLALVPDARRAGMVLAWTEDCQQLLAIPLDADGVTSSPRELVDYRDYARVEVSGLTHDAATKLAHGKQAEALAARASQLGALLTAGELQGIARECFERTVEYLKTREQFGVKIGTFQALQHRAARLYIALELATGVLRKAMRACDAGADDADELAMHAKLRCAETCARVVDEAIQMHGGIGVTDELDIGLFLKRARVLALLWGDSAALRERLAVQRYELTPSPPEQASATS